MMNFSVVYRLFHFSRNSIIPIQYTVQTREYIGSVTRSGGKKLKKTLVAVEKKVLPVETDVNRLLTHVCGTNICKEGGKDIELKPDSEYPSWLWNIRTGPPPPLEELDPNTKQYYRKLRLLGLRRNNQKSTTRKF
ncbi:PREDICTED: 39S ribosomal protein L54, mitochondrial [Cyphomyrmex costatus]|uniref:Large ribosomal subunit protein mL54 n=1 Tax=Cyphomyrmex costatus TaxID=456900 RepID=A0A151IDQ1_9HYME|nr:PREDICTED: 39S ribosomal protein L54, mitochondrial [Cyphomyrmex costatus]KYM98839.1 39S ribosomal protein L54, mitochondrial [Cyphomyrmex costatus]